MMDDSANTNIEVTQKAALGGATMQIGQQNNYYGLTPDQACQTAIAMFKEYYPMLRQEALDEVSDIVNRELQKIPRPDIQAPSPKIAVPLLQNASITEETNLREMYGKLLAGDMNKKLKPLVHPAYVEIINQMSSDDAELFSRVFEIQNSIPVAGIRFTFSSRYLTHVFPHYFSPYFSGIDPWKASVSIENLTRLNLFHFFEGTVTGYDYKQIKQDPFVKERFEFAKQNKPSHTLSIELSSYVIQPNDFGRRFASLCL